MTDAQARAQLDAFLKGETLTFSFSHEPSGEWVATCNQIPGIVTGGMGDDITEMDRLLRDAIVTAAGVPTEFAHVLRFVSYKERPTKERPLRSLFRWGGEMIDGVQGHEARYVVA